jgi:hypothetical protein
VQFKEPSLPVLEDGDTEEDANLLMDVVCEALGVADELADLVLDALDP